MNRSRNRGLILLQLILEEILVAVITAIAIIVVMIIFGVLIGYREEIERRNIDTYVKVIGTPILILVTIYLYIRGLLGSDILLISMTWFLFVILNIDWKKVRTSQEVGNGNKAEKKKTTEILAHVLFSSPANRHSHPLSSTNDSLRPLSSIPK